MNISPSLPLLRIEQLQASFRTVLGSVVALRGVSFELGREKLGIVGESGSGKTTLGRALLRLLPATARLQGRVEFEGRDLLALRESEMERLRGAKLAMILQDAKHSLNPLMTVGEQIEEALDVHRRLDRRQRRKQVLEMLAAVHFTDPARIYSALAHELSGGMGQRVMIAMMLVAGPRVLVADEPTSALDATIRGQILSIMDELVLRTGTSIILISHDIDLVRRFCDRILVMHGGRIVDTVRSNEVEASQHPYTRALLAARPEIDRPVHVLPTLERDPAWAVVSS